jgi:hypothetical protein
MGSFASLTLRRNDESEAEVVTRVVVEAEGGHGPGLAARLPGVLAAGVRLATASYQV